MEYLQLAGLSLVGGVFSLLGGVLLLSKKNTAKNLAKFATPFAAGALLAAVFLDLLKDGLEESTSQTVLTATLVGMILFFLAERFLHWFHHHHLHEHADDKAHTKSLIIIGDTIHNAMDGVAIAAAFLVSPATGVITTIAVAAHEIPQEIGDFGLLLAKGMRRRNVILANMFSALATTVMALITFAIGSEEVLPTGILLGLSAGFLLYIAASDIIPDIHEQSPKNKLFEWRSLMLIAGVLTVGLSVNIAHRYIHADHDHGSESSVHSDEENHDEEHHEESAEHKETEHKD